MATLRLSREQNQARLNYAEAEQGRPKVNLIRHCEEHSDVAIYLVTDTRQNGHTLLLLTKTKLYGKKTFFSTDSYGSRTHVVRE